MALSTNVDFVIHNLRLAYLRNTEDPYATRVVSFNPNYSNDLHIRAAGFADSERWPELAMPVSPEPTPHKELPPDTTGRRPLRSGNAGDDAVIAHEPGKWPGATGLRYSKTIMAHHAGGAGMRIDGVRTTGGASYASRRLSGRMRSGSEPHQEPTSSTDTQETKGPDIHISSATSTNAGAGSSEIDRRRSSGGATVRGTPEPSGKAPPDANSDGEQVTTPMATVFKVPFARAAEMEERRRIRMRARFPDQNMVTTEPNRQKMTGPISLVDSSDDDEGESIDEDEDDGLDETDAEEGRELQEDEFTGSVFDPSFVQPSMVTSNDSGGMSLLSAQSGLSSSQPSGYDPLHAANSSTRSRNRLSPVAEGHRNVAPLSSPSHAHTSSSSTQPTQRASPTETTNKAGAIEVSPSMETPPAIPVLGPPRAANSRYANRVIPAWARAPPPAATPAPTVPPPPVATSQPHLTSSNSQTLSNKPSIASFKKKPLPSRLNTTSSSASTKSKSSLTAMLTSQSSSTDNPFTTLYAAMASRDALNSVKLTVYFPHSRTFKRKPMEIQVRKDVSVEEVIGHALWVYWEKSAEPRLDEGLAGEEAEGEAKERRNTRLSATGWCLKIVEDDGEVDDDYPVLGRTGSISRWNTFGLAVCEATSSEIRQNVATDSTLVRRPSRLMASTRSRSDAGSINTSSAASTLAPPSVNPSNAGATPDAATSSALINSGGGSVIVPPMMLGTPVFLRIRVAESADAIYYSTTLNVTPNMYMADVLDMVCRKRKLPSSKEWALLVDDMSILIPLDRTVASLEGQKDLVIIQQALVDQLGAGKGRRPGPSKDPNASIFDNGAHGADSPTSAANFISAYKKYTIHRKVPMAFGTNERVLTIDGDYIHLMPSRSKGVFDSLKSSSYHIKMVLSCIGKKDSSAIKLTVRREGGKKRYDFEADRPELANEIVTTIRNLMKTWQAEHGGGGTKGKGKRPRSAVVLN